MAETFTNVSVGLAVSAFTVLACKFNKILILPVKTVARDGNCLFRRLQLFCAVQITENMKLRVNTRETYTVLVGANGMHRGNDAIIAISEIY
jgi:hypothetical protein